MRQACSPYETDKMMCYLVSRNLLLVFVEQNHMKSKFFDLSRLS